MTSAIDRAMPAAPNPTAIVPPSTDISSSVITWSFVSLFVAIIFLQKFGITAGAATIPIGLPAAYAIILFLMVRNLGRVNTIRLALFSIFFGFGLVNLMAHQDASVPSFLLVSVLAFTFVFEVPVDGVTFQRCMRLFIGAMLLTVPVIFLEWGLQLVLGPGMWVDLDKVVPGALLVPGYMYHHPTSFGSPWMQPNAALFLEVSILSQFLAIALMIELAYFKRPFVLALLVVAMFVTLGGSGPFFLVLSAPILIFYIPRRLLVPGAIFIIVTLFLLSMTSVFWDFAGRIFEYQNPRSSTYGRYVVPFRVLREQLLSSGGIFYGGGPGSGDDAGAGFSLGKLIYEYGWLPAMAYCGLFLHMLIRSGHKLLVIWAFSLFFAFLGGGLGVPLYPLACMALGGLLCIREDAARQAPIDVATY